MLKIKQINVKAIRLSQQSYRKAVLPVLTPLRLPSTLQSTQSKIQVRDTMTLSRKTMQPDTEAKGGLLRED